MVSKQCLKKIKKVAASIKAVVPGCMLHQQALIKRANVSEMYNGHTVNL
jgi:hypothetical protein